MTLANNFTDVMTEVWNVNDFSGQPWESMKIVQRKLQTHTGDGGVELGSNYFAGYRLELLPRFLISHGADQSETDNHIPHRYLY
jgi:hypothetical protein